MQPSVEAFQEEAEAAGRAVRDEFGDLPGFPPICDRCDRVMLYRRVHLGGKKWRWMWVCPGCGAQIYSAALEWAELNG